MGNDCSKPCKKTPKSSKFPEARPTISVERFASANNRDTVDQYSLTSFKEVQNLAYKGHLSELKRYLDSGFLVDFPLDQSGWTLLHLACQNGNIKLVELLLNYHPYLDAQELSEGWSPLMVSVVNDFQEIFSMLVQTGADKFLKDQSGKTALDLATKYKSKKILNTLNLNP